MKIIYSMYRTGEVSVHRACCERATKPYSLGGGGTIYPGSRPAGVTTRSPRMVTESLFTRLMLIKMYFLFMVCACICTIVFTISQFHAGVYMYLGGWGGARWLSGRVSDSGTRGPGFETYLRRVVSLSKTLYSPKVLVNYPGSDGSVPTWLKNCWLGR